MHLAARDAEVEGDGRADLDGHLEHLEAVEPERDREEAAAAEAEHGDEERVLALAEVEAGARGLAGERHGDPGTEGDVLDREHADADGRDRDGEARGHRGRLDVDGGPAVPELQVLLQLVHELERALELNFVDVDVDVRLRAALRRELQLVEADADEVERRVAGDERDLAVAQVADDLVRRRGRRDDRRAERRVDRERAIGVGVEDVQRVLLQLRDEVHGRDDLRRRLRRVAAGIDRVRDELGDLRLAREAEDLVDDLLEEDPAEDLRPLEEHGRIELRRERAHAAADRAERARESGDAQVRVHEAARVVAGGLVLVDEGEVDVRLQLHEDRAGVRAAVEPAVDEVGMRLDDGRAQRLAALHLLDAVEAHVGLGPDREPARVERGDRRARLDRVEVHRLDLDRGVAGLAAGQALLLVLALRARRHADLLPAEVRLLQLRDERRVPRRAAHLELAGDVVVAHVLDVQVLELAGHLVRDVGERQREVARLTVAVGARDVEAERLVGDDRDEREILLVLERPLVLRGADARVVERRRDRRLQLDSRVRELAAPVGLRVRFGVVHHRLAHEDELAASQVRGALARAPDRLDLALADLDERGRMPEREQPAQGDDAHELVAAHRRDVAPLAEVEDERPGLRRLGEVAARLLPRAERAEHDVLDIDRPRRIVARRVLQVEVRAQVDDRPAVERLDVHVERIRGGRWRAIAEAVGPDRAHLALGIVRLVGRRAVLHSEPRVPELGPSVAHHGRLRMRPRRTGVRREDDVPWRLERGLGVGRRADRPIGGRDARRGRDRDDARFELREVEERAERERERRRRCRNAERQARSSGEARLDVARSRGRRVAGAVAGLDEDLLADVLRRVVRAVPRGGDDVRRLRRVLAHEVALVVAHEVVEVEAHSEHVVAPQD